MSAHIDFIDTTKRVIWACYEGRGDELEANLRGYGVEYIPTFRNGRIGIGFARYCPEERGEQAQLAKAVEDLVDILTQRSGVTKQQERRFVEALSIVQSFQAQVSEVAS
ncbi:MAG TPA: hypothetical protein PLB91_01085 [Spirochaetales bacterium]|nr:hypothetical protein [Spirochaetales bacterium]